MNWKSYYTILPFLIFLIACSPKSEETVKQSVEVTVNYPEGIPSTLKECIENYGGIEAWIKAKTLEYDLLKPNKTEHHIIDLNTRKVKLSAEMFSLDTIDGQPQKSVTGGYELGFDGKEVWVTPNKAAFGNGSPRFYHNLYFYFFAFPHIVTDPGISYQDFGLQDVGGIELHKIGISYGDNVGDSPEDVYNLFINPESKELEFITYTVTYFSGKASDRYNALKYSNWTSAGNLKFAQTLTSYKWDGEKLGDVRGETKFGAIQLSETAPDQSLFVMPQGAEIDSLQKN